MIKKGDKIGEYMLVEKVGSGGFGDVWKAEKRTVLDTNHFALKFFRPKNDNLIDLEKIGKELSVWKKLRGLPHIISVIELDRFDDYVYVVSDFADGGSLEKYLNTKNDEPLSEKEAVEITLDILTGLESLHNKQIIHRDLKPDNVLIMNGRYCLTDFGVSREIKSQSKATDAAGTMEYMPPEAFENKFSSKTDIWAVGVILQRLLTGRLPFQRDNQAALIGAILQIEPEAMPVNISNELREIVNRCLKKNPELRFRSASELKAEVQNFAKTLPGEDLAPESFDRAEQTLLLLDQEDAAVVTEDDAAVITEVLSARENVTTQSFVQPQPEGITASEGGHSTNEALEFETAKMENDFQTSAIDEERKPPVAAKSRMSPRWIGVAVLGLLVVILGGAAFYSLTSNWKEISRNNDLVNLPVNAPIDSTVETKTDENSVIPPNNTNQPIDSGNIISNRNSSSTPETEPTTKITPASTPKNEEMPTISVPTPLNRLEREEEKYGLKDGQGDSPFLNRPSTGGGYGDGSGTGTGMGSGRGSSEITPNPTPTTGGVTQALRILSKPKANYTDAARQNAIQGTVTLRVTFNADGTIGQISVISGLTNGLTEQAIAAARLIRFEPMKVNGVPVKTTKSIPYTFTIY